MFNALANCESNMFGSGFAGLGYITMMLDFSLRSWRTLCKTGLAILLALAVLTTEASALSTFSQVKSSHRRSDALILDRRGEVIHELRIDRTGRRLDWMELKDISPSLVKAVLQSEDQHFYQHGGVDWKAVGAAAIEVRNRRICLESVRNILSRLKQILQPRPEILAR